MKRLNIGCDNVDNTIDNNAEVDDDVDDDVDVDDEPMLPKRYEYGDSMLT